MFKISRNEPCWCGSGRKYKQCHYEKDEKLRDLRSQGYPVPKRRLILNDGQIEGIRKSSELSVKIMDYLDTVIKEGMTTQEIDDIVYKMTTDAGAIPAPLNYEGFPKSVCTSINEVVCHGIPDKKRVLKSGDILNVDVTSILGGYYSDMSRMYLIGEVSDEAKRLVEVTKKCMDIGIEAIKPYEPVGNIGEAIEPFANENGYSVVRMLAGHGVGIGFHEDPVVNHFREKYKTMILVPGMVLTVEPMINQGTHRCHILDDDWTVVTDDKKLSAQWEHTVLVTETGAEILTE